jgi:hypothetical protein
MSDLERLLGDLDLSGLPNRPTEDPHATPYVDYLASIGYRVATDEEYAAYVRLATKLKRDYIHGLAAELGLTKAERRKVFKAVDHLDAWKIAARLLRDRIAGTGAAG